MSDPATLSPAAAVVRCTLGGQPVALAERDIDAELILQTRHESWASARLEARRAMIGERAFQSQLDRLGHAMDANRFAFGGPLSLEWLTTRAGMAEYVLLLSQKAQAEGHGPAIGRERLLALARAGGAEWEQLYEQVLRRDFPFLLPAEEATPQGGATASGSGATATP